MDRVYLDHNATTPPYPEVLEEVARVARSDWANPSSLHAEGRRARSVLDDSRERVASVLGVRATEVFFTSGATEANNLALAGLRPPALAVSAVEHPSVLETARRLAKSGAALTILGVDSAGRVRLDQAAMAIASRPALVSVMAANNETGALQPLDEIARLCREAGVLLHVDATQILGRVPLHARALAIALLSASGHKIHGPKGIGILVRREGLRLDPLLTGGHQESGLRAGTENVAGAAGFARALEMVCARVEERRVAMEALRDRLAAGLLALEPRLRRNGDPEHSLPNTLNVSFPGLSAETLLLSLDLEGVAASSGSACSSGSIEPSPVLLAMGLPRRIALSSLRLSVDDSNSPDDIDRALEAFGRVLARVGRRT